MVARSDHVPLKYFATMMNASDLIESSFARWSFITKKLVVVRNLTTSPEIDDALAVVHCICGEQILEIFNT